MVAGFVSMPVLTRALTKEEYGLLNLTNTPGVVDEDPLWSPDGSRIAFASMKDERSQIVILNLADLTVSPVTNYPLGVIARMPDWSPDGEQLVFATRMLGIYELLTLHLAGGEPEKLT
jgi:Tol biopolymer transport system component